MPPTLKELLEPQRAHICKVNPGTGRHVVKDKVIVHVAVSVADAREILGALPRRDPELGRASYEAHEGAMLADTPLMGAVPWEDLPAGDQAHWAKVEAATEHRITELLLAHLQRDIDTLNKQAQFHHEGGTPLAVHHRVTKADAYQQVVYLLQRLLRWGESPVAELRRRLALGQPLVGEPFERGPHLHAYRDACHVAQLFAKQPLRTRAHRAAELASQTIYGLYQQAGTDPRNRSIAVQNAVIDALNVVLRDPEETPALRDVLAERRRQVAEERCTPEHDDEHDAGVLAGAAVNYALHAACHLHPISMGDGADELPNEAWLFDAAWFKPGDPRRNLIKAGALILAEVEKHDRALAREAAHG